MIAKTSAPTLLDDWQQRRSQLEGETRTSSDQTVALIKVLDYLIRRYQGTDAASRPARAAAPQATVLNTRAMVVHHHAWSGVVAGVKSRGQAQERMAGVLHRMKESSRQRAAGDIADQLDSEDDMGEVQFTSMHRALGSEAILKYAFSFGIGERWAIRRCLAASPYLPRYAVLHLAARASLAPVQDAEAVALLARCGSRHVYELAARALGERIERVGTDAIVVSLSALLRDPRVQKFFYPKSVQAARARLRERLASEEPVERLRTISVLALLGDLHDVSLLADLAAVSRLDETCPEEHAALVAAIDAISRQSLVDPHE